VIAHLGVVPLEELLPTAAALLTARAWLMPRLRRRREAAT
jgi:hypothetical protein